MKRTNIILAFIAALLIPVIAFSQTKLIKEVTAENPYDIPYKKYELENGLTLIIHEDHSDPIVNVNVTYHVGSNRESIGKSGFAHLYEHMMFQGSQNVEDEEHFKLVSEAGGTLNGTTNRDRTNYFETVPSNQLETALWLEADRMGYLLPAITEKKFEVQRSTVKNEKSQNVENQPYGLVYEVMGQTLYPSGHPYSWPVIGYVDDLNRVTVEDVRNFFLRWYGPNNAILTVSGDVNEGEVIALAEKYFGPIPKGPEVEKMQPDVPILPTDQYGSYADNIYFPLTLMVFPVAEAYHRDEPALDVMAAMMGEGNNSIFYQEFVKTEEAAQAGVFYSPSELAGELLIQVVAYPDEGMEEIESHFTNVEKKIKEVLDEFGKTGITEKALERIKNKRKADFVDYKTSVAWKGMLLTEWEMLTDSRYNLSDGISDYERLTKADIIRVYNKYIKGRNAAIINVYPKSPFDEDSVKSVNPYASVEIKDDPQYANLDYRIPEDTFDRSVRPKPAEAKMPRVPEYYTEIFENGMEIIGTKTSEVPKVVLRMEIDGGELLNNDDLKRMGLASITADLMNESTKNYTTEEISAELERLGSSVSISGSKKATYITVESMSDKLEETLALLEEKLFNPAFNEEDFKRVKKQTIENLKQQKKSPGYLASTAYDYFLYGENALGVAATQDTYDKIELSDVKAYYEKAFSPSVTRMTIVGDIDKEEVIPMLGFLKEWEAKEVKLPKITNLPQPDKTQIHIIHKPYSTQSVIRMGHFSLPYDATGEHYKSDIMNYKLGGSFNSRLNLNLREDKGWTYGIRSGFAGDKDMGQFYVSASVKAEATDSSLTEIMKEIREFRSKGVTEEELEATRKSMLNNRALDYETPFQKASFLSSIVKYDLEDGFVDKQARILENITLQEINNLAKKNIDPDRMHIIVVGNKYTLKKKLKDLDLGDVNTKSPY